MCLIKLKSRTFWRMCQIYSQGTQWFANPGKHEWTVCGLHWACDWKVGKGGGSCGTSGEARPRSLLQTLVLRVPTSDLSMCFTGHFILIWLLVSLLTTRVSPSACWFQADYMFKSWPRKYVYPSSDDWELRHSKKLKSLFYLLCCVWMSSYCKQMF
jgi:hypothetical protein